MAKWCIATQVAPRGYWVSIARCKSITKRLGKPFILFVAAMTTCDKPEDAIKVGIDLDAIKPMGIFMKSV